MLMPFQRLTPIPMHTPTFSFRLTEILYAKQIITLKYSFIPMVRLKIRELVDFPSMHCMIRH